MRDGLAVTHMDVLIVEPLESEVLQWLGARHATRYAPELARDPRAFRQALYAVRALVIPPSVALDASALRVAPMLRTVGRLSSGAENIDVEACVAAGVEVVRPASASATAEAEFAIGALLQMLRRVPVLSSEGLLVGRELGSCTVGLVGMTPAARPLAELLRAFGARVVGYDPAVHASDGLWSRWNIEPIGLRELMEQSDAVCVLLTYFTRYEGLIGERYLTIARQDQVVLSLGHSSLFDEYSLADALSGGRLAAAWFDSLEPGLLAPGRPLHGVDTLQVTPRVSSTTRESRIRSAWAVARRIDEVLNQPQLRAEFRTTSSDEPIGLEAGPAPA
jgi:D-3-phosphoglycerate dehydrogenase / 2-oxoglutarate reductase